MKKDIWSSIFEKLEEENNKYSTSFIQNILFRIIGRSYTTCKSYLDDWLLNDIENSQDNLNEKRLNQWKKTLKNIARNTILSKATLNTLKIMIHRVNVTSKDALLFLIKTETSQLVNNIQQKTFSHLQNRYVENCLQIYYQISKKTKEHIVPIENISESSKKAVNSSFGTNPQNYSKTTNNIFTYLYNSLDLEIQQALASKKSPKEIQEILTNRFEIAQNDSVRMVRTYGAIASSKATKDSFQEIGLKEYEILATLDDRTSEICQDMDRKIFPVSEYQVGVTAPPFHYNCRSTIMPVISTDQLSTRIARNESKKNIHIPENMSYKQWKDQYFSEK